MVLQENTVDKTTAVWGGEQNRNNAIQENIWMQVGFYVKPQTFPEFLSLNKSGDWFKQKTLIFQWHAGHFVRKTFEDNGTLKSFTI
jgi:hypothetical protein